MRTIEKTIYKFDELSDCAKEKAREWYREGQLDYEWWDSVYDWAESVANVIGVSFDRRHQNNPKAIGQPCIYFSGFWSQGDGACFEGTWYHSDMLARSELEKECPQEKDVFAIYDALIACEGYSASVKHRGRYSHEHTMEISVDAPEDVEQEAFSVAEEVIVEAMRDFARWIYARLEKEHEYLTSDEQVDESIRANEYEFDEYGSLD